MLLCKCILWNKNYSDFHFDVESWLIASICRVGESFHNVNFIGISNLKILVNWHFIFSGKIMLLSSCEWHSNGGSIRHWHFCSKFEPEWLSTDTFVGVFHKRILDLSCCWISVKFTLPSKSHESRHAVWSEPKLTPFLIFPGNKTLSFRNFLITNIKYSSGSNIEILLIN